MLNINSFAILDLDIYLIHLSTVNAFIKILLSEKQKLTEFLFLPFRTSMYFHEKFILNDNFLNRIRLIPNVSLWFDKFNILNVSNHLCVEHFSLIYYFIV